MYVRVEVISASKKEVMEEKKPGSFLIQVKEKAERNMANTRVLALLSRYYKVLARSVKIITGHHSPRKIISVENPA